MSAQDPHRPGRVTWPVPGYAGQEHKDWKWETAMKTVKQAMENME